MANKVTFSFTNSGFFSEINNFILGALYAKKNKLDLVIDFSSLAFIDESTLTSIIDFQKFQILKSKIVSNASTRNYGTYLFPNTGKARANRLIKYFYFNLIYIFYLKVLGCNIDILQKHWKNIRKTRLHLNINDKEFLYKIAKRLWIHNTHNKYSKLGLYIGVHIRRGDKIIETEFHNNRKYILEIKKYCKKYDTREVVLFTDSIKDCKLIKEKLKKYNIHLIPHDIEGYHHKEFLKKPSIYKTKSTLMICDVVNYMNDAAHFIGSNDGNLSAFVSLLRSGKNVSDLRMGNLLIY
jgi:hypothetical protein